MTQQKGVTLIEVMLVLAIAALLIVMGIRQYQSYRSDVDIQQFQNDIDQLFQAMKGFYSANCGPQYDNSIPPPNNVIGRPLYVAAMDNNTPFHIDIQTDLIENGYLSQAPSVNHPFVTDYIVQFNEYTHPKIVCINSADCTDPNNQQQVGTIITWKIQVAVKLRDPTQIDTYQKLLNADCASVLNGNIVTQCASTTPPDAEYLVFERLPSFASPKIQSGFELMLPAAKQFQQMYSTYPISNLTGRSHTPEYQYFTCGI